MANLPKIWRGVKRKKKKKVMPGSGEDGRLSGDDSSSFQCEEVSPSPEVPKGFELQFSTEPPPYMCVPDDSVSYGLLVSSVRAEEAFQGQNNK